MEIIEEVNHDNPEELRKFQLAQSLMDAVDTLERNRVIDQSEIDSISLKIAKKTGYMRVFNIEDCEVSDG